MRNDVFVGETKLERIGGLGEEMIGKVGDGRRKGIRKKVGVGNDKSIDFIGITKHLECYSAI